MSIGKIVKAHRQARGKTIKDFADLLHVSPITVSRLESGQQAILSTAMIAKLNGILEEEDYAQMNPDDPEESKLLAYHMKKNYVQKKQFLVGSESILDYLDSLVERNEFQLESYDNQPEQLRAYTRDYGRGAWAVSTAYAVDLLEADDESEYRQHIAATIADTLQKSLGFICMNPEIKKLSFFVPEEVGGFVATILRNTAPWLSICDLSVLCYQNRPCHNPFSEIDVFLNPGDDGFFQVESKEGKEEFVNWKMTLIGR